MVRLLTAILLLACVIVTVKEGVFIPGLETLWSKSQAFWDENKYLALFCGAYLFWLLISCVRSKGNLFFLTCLVSICVIHNYVGESVDWVTLPFGMRAHIVICGLALLITPFINLKDPDDSVSIFMGCTLLFTIALQLLDVFYFGAAVAIPKAYTWLLIGVIVIAVLAYFSNDSDSGETSGGGSFWKGAAAGAAATYVATKPSDTHETICGNCGAIGRAPFAGPPGKKAIGKCKQCRSSTLYFRD